MKKIIMLGGVLCLLTSAAANAQISIQANFGDPEPAYVEAPDYVAPYPIYPTYGVEAARVHHWHGARRGHVAARGGHRR